MTDQALLEQAARWIREADGLLVTAGAGMGVDSGLPDLRSLEGFWNAYPPRSTINRGLRRIGFGQFETSGSDSRMAEAEHTAARYVHAASSPETTLQWMQLRRILTAGERSARASSPKQMFHADIQHAPHGRRPIIQLPVIYEKLEERCSIPEAWHRLEARCNVCRHTCQLCPLQPVAFSGVCYSPHPRRLNLVICAKPAACARVTDELRQNEEAEQVSAL